MPASLAGSRGRVKRSESNASGLLFIKGLLGGYVSLVELYNQFITQLSPKNVTLVVNNACNLRCAHCYLQVNKLTASALAEEEWKLLIDSIVRLNPELICLSGREIFLGNTGVHILSYLRETKDREQAPYRIGFITNGTLIHNYWDPILRIHPSYFDISLDGIEADHDAVRGKGAFALVLPNIGWAAKVFRKKFFINLTLQKQNYTRLVDAVNFLQQRGVQNISCGFYCPLTYTAKHLALADEDVDFIFENLSELESIPLLNPLTILLDLDITTLQHLKAFLRSKWFSFDAIRQDINGEHYIEHWLKNGIRLEIRFALYPTGIWRSVRITPEGNYLAAEDTIDTTFYAERSIGNVRDFNYDFQALHAYALTSERFRELLHEYYYDVLPDLIAASHCQYHSVSLAA